MYRLVAFATNPFNAGIGSRVLERWGEQPTMEVVQGMIDRFRVPYSYSKVRWVNVEPSHSQLVAAVWFELQYCNDKGFFHVDVDDDRNWHIAFPKRDWTVNDE